MPRKTLTDRFVKGAKVKARTVYFDTKVRGLALRVAPPPSRAKTWWFVYRVKGSPSQWLRLGALSPKFGLKEARIEASTKRVRVDVEAADPAKERREAKKAPKPSGIGTFADFVPTYVAFAKGRKRTWEEDQRNIHLHLMPVWGEVPLKALTRRHVHDLLDGLVKQGMTVGVNRIQALVSRLFTVALDRGLIDAHPAARMLKRFAEAPRERVLSDDELKVLAKGLDEHPGAGADVIWLRLRLGQRGGEVAGMRWSELDLEQGIWTMPGDRTKNKRPHAVPLPAKALELLKTRHATRPTPANGVKDPEADQVFPGLMLTSKELRPLGEIHGGAYEWKDLRRTIASRLAALGFSETVIGRTLNHARYTVTAKHYNQHEYLKEKREALEAWELELRRITAHPPEAQHDGEAG